MLKVRHLLVSLTMVLKAYAKINLGLRILRKREDGFHDIETIFYRINLFDELTIEPSENVISIRPTIKRSPQTRIICAGRPSSFSGLKSAQHEA